MARFNLVYQSCVAFPSKALNKFHKIYFCQFTVAEMGKAKGLPGTCSVDNLWHQFVNIILLKVTYTLDLVKVNKEMDNRMDVE